MLELLKAKAKLVRKWCLVATSKAGSGHPTSCLSAADLTTVLFDHFFNYDLKNPQNPNNDRLIFSKGHCAPLFYTLFAMSNGLSVKKLETLREFNSELEGHPVPKFQYADVATGSLGQGLSIGAGFALSAKKDNLQFKTYVLLGDGEIAEGQVFEAANFASFYRLDNLIAIVDVNRLGQSQETMFGYRLEEYFNRFKAFGWETVVIDGHNFKEIEKALKTATENKNGRPFAIIAKTVKGKGVSFLEDKEGWHGKVLTKEELEKALKELGEVDETLQFNLSTRGPVASFPPTSAPSDVRFATNSVRAVGSPSTGATPPSFFDLKNKEIATREVYGKILAELAKDNPLIYALDADVKNSTFSEDFKKSFPDRFIECFIAEQNMVSVALGLSKLGKIPFISTFAAFLTRAFDQIRMSAISKANIKFVGSHAGISIGQDGPSQMGIEDIAMFGAIPDSIIFHPCDAISTAKIIFLMLNHKSISYLRTLRPKIPLIYLENEEFMIGGSKIIRESKEDILTVVAAGITVHEALKAYEELKKEGIFIRIMDCYSIKPIDKKGLVRCISETKEKILITVEDHYPHGGLGDFVLEAVAKENVLVEKMAVSKIPCSGTKEELLNFTEINAENIVKRIKAVIE